jgi:hypothetical protein
MILVHQRYFAKPDMRDRVLDTRVEASRRLMELGVPAGQIWVPARTAANLRSVSGEAADGLPDVIWECTYESLAAREEFRARQESDPRFHAIRTHQGTQLSRWLREHYDLVDLPAKKP